MTRRRLTTKQADKRSSSTPPVPSDGDGESRVKHARITSIVRLPDGDDLPICANEDEYEVEQALKEPVIYNNHTEFNEEELKKAMMSEKESLDKFDVKEEVPVEQVSQAVLSTVMSLVWVHVWKGSVKSRLCVRGLDQVINDLDDTYASTPMIYILRLLFLLALQHGWCIRLFDISTAFLHATLSSTDPIYVWPPKEFYPGGGILWKLEKAMYGLRTAPRDWQLHFAHVLHTLGFHRCQSDANVYIHYIKCVIIYAYVDDLLMLGTAVALDQILELIKEHFLIKYTGELDTEGSKARFLRRCLKRAGDSIILYMDENYLSEEFKDYSLEKCRPANTTGTSEVKRIQDGDEALDDIEHRRYRRSVGRLQWICPLRPDICFAVKELARALASPTREDQARLKHLLRYLKGTLGYVFVLAVSVILIGAALEIVCYCDSDWAGDLKTRKSTSGFLVMLFVCAFHFGARTQSVHALSSGEAELYGIGSATSEALHIKSFLVELKLYKVIKILVYTDSTAGKSMAARFGISKKLRHVQLRYLFVQHLVAQSIVKLFKTPGTDNPADIFTKYVKADTLQQHLSKVGLVSTVQHYRIYMAMKTNVVYTNGKFYELYYTVYAYFYDLFYRIYNEVYLHYDIVYHVYCNNPVNINEVLYLAYFTGKGFYVMRYIVYAYYCDKLYCMIYLLYCVVCIM